LKEKDTFVTNPQTDDDWIIHSINIHGIFFERWCEDVICSTPGLKVVSTNYPVEFPPPNGLWRGKESALDLRAELRHDHLVATFIIECKKNNPDFVNWIFFPKGRAAEQRQFALYVIRNQIKEDLSQRWNVQSQLFRSLRPATIFNEARETRTDYQSYTKGQKTKTSNAAITEAAYQVALATKAIVNEEAEHSKKRAAHNPIPPLDYHTQLIVPCIVTTAKLYSCSFDPKDVDTERGEVPFKKAVLQEMPFVVYEYPLPKHLQSTPEDLVEALSSNNLELFTRMDIVVMNSQYFENLLSEQNFAEDLLTFLKDYGLTT
jgi:hypothetical protein